MAKGSKNGRSRTREDLSSLTVSLRSFQRIAPIRAVEDRRTFDFEPGTRPARLFTGSTSSITATPVAKKTGRAQGRVPYQIAFSAPHDTLVCVRRKRRKEVLHAKKKTGRGGQKKPRRSNFSEVKC